jgi:hypothetical protein
MNLPDRGALELEAVDSLRDAFSSSVDDVDVDVDSIHPSARPVV